MTHEAIDRTPSERRILYVISRYTHRSTFIVREIEALAARGWEITVVSLRRPVFAPGTMAAERPYTIIYDSFMSVRILTSAVAALVSGWPAIADYIHLAVATFRFDLRPLVRNLIVIPKACHYAAVVRRSGYRHIHAHWATVSTSTAMLMSRLSGVPFSFTGHAWDIFCDTRLLAEKGAAARFVLTCTAYNRRHLIQGGGIEAGKIHVLYHGLRLPRGPEPRVDSLGRPLELLTVGRWSEKKGLLELVEAAALVRDAGVRFRLHIVAGEGSASYERRVRHTIAARRLSGRVRICGWLSEDHVEAVMRASDLLVMPCVTPSDGAMDGIPNVLIEALAVELPVVATRLSGIPELVRHHETGLLVNERDPRDLAAALIWCAGHMADMRQMAAAGRRLVECTFDISRTIPTLEGHFAAAIAGRAMPALQHVSAAAELAR